MDGSMRVLKSIPTCCARKLPLQSFPSGLEIKKIWREKLGFFVRSERLIALGKKKKKNQTVAKMSLKKLKWKLRISK